MFKFHLGLLASQITMANPQIQLKTFPELFSSDQNFVVGFNITEILKTIPEYLKAVQDDRVSLRIMSRDFKTYNESDKVFIAPCYFLNDYLANSRKKFYILPQRANSYLTLHLLGFMSPYKEVFQDLINQIYSAGLPQAWERFEDIENFKHQEEEKEPPNFLTFNKFFRIFSFLLQGFLSGALVFLLEIIYAKFKPNLLSMRRRNRVQPFLM